jgi:hypothetical protein
MSKDVDRSLPVSVDAGAVRDEAAVQSLDPSETLGSKDVDSEHDLSSEWRDGCRKGWSRDGGAAATGAAGKSDGAQRT